ncbi:DNA-binding transcriptional regulator, CsgD family [Streptoalloteichus hindustanus]|uniref:DNA-binding transcriptional regulator, CsgD family n=2 Tax=Streptoalloteichus hindustanus TaxID=2017 RepID=A0A1M5EUK4_STRHI|nr:DNA-binding transcriptional regulator, CsgD family [Streptoalloteichus hindustanus]
MPEAARQGATSGEVAELVSDAIATEVPHDALRLLGTSPTSGSTLGSFSFWHGYDPDFGREILREHYLGEDPLPIAELARRPSPVGVLGQGHQLLADHGVGSELRLALRDDRGVWGALGLARAPGRRPFDRADAHRVAELGSCLIAALRGYVTAGPLAPVAPSLPAGVMILGPDHRLRAITPQAVQWLTRERSCQELPRWASEAFLLGMSTQARKSARDPRVPTPTAWGPTVIHGRWVSYQGQPLDEDGVGDVAVVIHAAAGPQLLPVLCDWYGISKREQQVITDLCDGVAPKQIARRRKLSVHTVNDHLKAVFRKTGASGRDELITAVAG